VAAATAIVDYNLMDANPSTVRAKRSPYARIIRGLALKGSAAAGDTVTDLYIDAIFSGRFYNSGTGFPNLDDLKPVGQRVPAGSEITLPVVKAAATNPINAIISTVE
jgi:hypothetical protein